MSGSPFLGQKTVPPRARTPRAVWHGARALADALVSPAHTTAPLLADAPRPWLRRLPYVLTGALIIILLPTGIQVLSHDYGLTGGMAGALSAAQTLPLLLALTRPLFAWVVVLSADTAGALALLTVPGDDLRPWPWTATVIVGYLPLCLALALRQGRRTLVLVWLATVGVSLGMGVADPGRGSGTGVLLPVLAGVVLLVGALGRERADARRRLAAAETAGEVERARRTLLEERARIARELHDVVAHHMSVIIVQADSAPYRITDLPDRASEEFGTIAGSARESLTEMRRLLGVLRSEQAGGERAPQPGVGQLRQLVEATVRGGVPVDLTVGSPGLSTAPSPVQLTVYRIVQEALANVLRHAPGAVTRVSVTGDGVRVTVLVVNGPSAEPGPAPLETAGTGHGLVGMRERVRAAGGTLDTGPLPDGGFRVAAGLPLNRKDGGLS